jgi:hypothetical protein
MNYSVCRRIRMALSVCLAIAFSAADTAAQGTVLNGTLNGAAFNIQVPATWNGTLIVIAHGYRERGNGPLDVPDTSAPTGPGGDAAALGAALVSQGYAVASSAYSENGWAVKEALQNTGALTERFRTTVAVPNHTILLAFSMGTVAAFQSLEREDSPYDAAICGCAVAAGSSLNWDHATAVLLAYDVAFGMPPSWGTVADMRDDLDFQTEVAPVLIAQVLNPANIAKFEFIRLVTALPADGFYGGPNWLFTVMFFATEARAELETRAKGPVAQNRDHTYTVSAAHQLYLAALGVNAPALLADMNARRTITPETAARNYLRQYADFTGAITRPVLTVHTTIDGLVLPANESVYRDTVAAAGRSHLLAQVYTDPTPAGVVGHCAFNFLQVLFSVRAVEFWLATGIPPNPANPAMFPPSFGFLGASGFEAIGFTAFVPPSWHQPVPAPRR